MRKRLVTLACVVVFLSTAVANATCVSAPSISASLAGPDSQGNITITGGWTFHNTDPNFTGVVSVNDSYSHSVLYRDDHAPLSGSFPPVIENMYCRSSGNNPYHFQATASGCGDASQDLPLNLPSTIPTVTITGGAADPVTATAPLTVTYNFPLSRVSDPLPYISSPVSACQPHDLPQSGSFQCTMSTACLSTGAHDVTATGWNCSGDVSPVAHGTVTVNSKPTVTLDANNQDGIVAFTVGWSFPNTVSYEDRAVTVIRDGCCTDYWNYQGPVNQTDSAHFTIDTTCWPKGTHTWVATATNICTNPNESMTAQQTINVQGGKPEVHLTLAPRAQPLSGYDLTVSWKFPSNTTLAQRSVAVTCDTGDCPSIDPIIADPATGTKTITIDHLDTYTHFTATATNSHCNPALTAKDEAGAGGCCPAGSAGQPVLVNLGSVQADDTDPLPQQNVLHLSRAYDSDNHVQGLFGTGWTSLLDSNIRIAPSAGSQVIVVTLESHTQYFFWLDGGQYSQLWPKGQQVMATLSGNTTSGFVFREAASQTTRTFSGAGKLLNITSLRDGRTISISYDANSLPTAITDSWGTFSFAITTDSASHLITNIQAASGISWTYQYASTNLTAVLAPDGQPWRTYVYDASGHLTEVHDALGNLLESHAYDANGRGTSSLQASDDVQNISFAQAGRVAGETVTQVTYTSGRVVSYYVRGTSGVLHTVEVRGGCSTCSQDEDVTYTFDSFNHVIREQDGRGYVRESAYDFTSGQLTSMTGPLKPSTCDPQTDSGHCRMTTDDLAAATLVATPLTKTTTYTYGNGTWPDLPTVITTTSVANASDVKTESFTYDAATGIALAHSETGWTSATQSETHTTTTTLYNGTEAAAFNPGGPFQSAWLTLAQPSGLRKQMDGPRTDVSDVVTFVYYPIDGSVTGTWRGRLAAIRDALGHVTTYSDYDVFGNAMTVVDPNGVVMNTTYDGLGRLLTAKYPAISGCDTTADPTCNVDIVNSRSYSPGGGPLSTETKPRGGVTTYTYDGRGRVASITRTISSTVSERIEYDYDPNTGQKSAERLLDNSTGSFVVRKSDAFSYDSQGHLSQVQHPDASRVLYLYDVAGALATVQDENHSSANTFYAYNENGALASVKQTLGSGQITTSYGYDVQGNLRNVTDPNGNVTTYGYDDFGRMLTQVSPVTGTTSYGYDLAGNLLTTTDANGATTSRTYDALSRLASAASALSGSPSETVTYSYDDSFVTGYDIGRFSSASDPTGTTTVRYDRRGLMRQLQQTVGDAQYSTLFTYDTDGNRSSITYPSSGRVATYTYDLAGRPLSVAASGTTFASSAAYLPFGPLTGFNYGNGLKRAMSYDTRYRITENKLFNPPTNIARYSYSYDAAGNILGIQDVMDGTYSRTFQYDDLNRLTTANTGTSLWQTGSYTYDAMGNLVSRSLGKPPVDDGTVLSVPGRHLRASTAVTGQVDRLSFTFLGTTPKISVVTTNGLDHTASYDGAGNETGYYAARTYSPRNLMNAVTDTSGEGPAHSISYGYDYRGVRVSRTETPTDAGNASRYYFYTPELQLLASTVDDSNNVWGQSAHFMSTPLVMNREIIWFNGQPVGEFGPPRTPDATAPLSQHRTFDTNTPANNLFYTFTDHLGTPLIQTDPTTAIVWRAEHEPYGNVYLMRKGSRADQPLRFPGQEAAMTWEGAEENYNVLRWYRGGWGRYTQGDPIGLAVSTNLYTYGNDSPPNSSDPLGESVVNVTKVDEVRYATLEAYQKVNPCHAPGSYSCTERLLEDIGCPCSCKGNGYGMDVAINVEVRYHLAGAPQGSSVPSAAFWLGYRKHEDLHFVDLKVQLKKYADSLEAMHFASEPECNLACGKAIGGFHQWLNDWAVDSNKRLH